MTSATTADSSGSSSEGTTLTTADSSSTDEPSSSSEGSSSESSSSGGPTCGDGAIDGEEVCDGNELGGEDCESQDFDGGTLACADDCMSFDTAACTNLMCGNDSIEGKEVCDGTALAGLTCETLDFDGGTLACDANCGGFDTSGCYACGDGVIEGPEVCDGAQLNDQTCATQDFTAGPLGCAADCSAFDTTQCTTCGDDVAAGTESCDGIDLGGNTCLTEGFDDGEISCAADCSLVLDACTDCGDGLIEGTEVCDGANLGGATCVSQGADFGTLACASDCSYDVEPCITVTDEVEPNDDADVAVDTVDFLLANAQGPFTDDVFIGAAITPAGDDDFFAVTNPGTGWAALRVETFGSAGPGTCNTDTWVEIRTAAETVLFTDDEGGINSCSLVPLYPMAPGETVYVRVIDYQDNGTIASYFADIQLAPAVCGNDTAELGEQCDDGNLDDGDGCSAACVAEGAVQEIEPNATSPEADATGIIVDGTTLLGGSIGTVGDLDRFRVELAAAGFLRFESFTSVNDCLAGQTMIVRVFDSVGTQIIADTSSFGIQSCGAITFPLPAGTFYVQVEENGNNALLPSYLLEVQTQADLGAESEPNDVIATADTNIQAAGSNVYVFGDHALTADEDFFAIDVPTDGSSLRLEIIEGDRTVETCENLGVDSRLTLYTSGGLELANDDDDGRGFCSMIDGTGTVPLDAGANGLAAGTYYAHVRASAAATVAGSQFIYRLVATVRTP
jgi:cysteine-rich repeat protein